MHWIITVISLLAFITVLALLLQRVKKLQKVAICLRESRDECHEVNNFLQKFSSHLSLDSNVADTMAFAATHVAERIGAESVGIYTKRYERLFLTGTYGQYPLTDSKNIFNAEQLCLRDFVEIGKGFVGMVGKNCEGELIPDVAIDERFINCKTRKLINSVMAVPLMQGDVLLGVICAVNNKENPNVAFTKEQYTQLSLISEQIIMMQNLAKLYGKINNQKQLNIELEFTRQLQQALFPYGDFPAWEPFSIMAYSRPAKEVNGDFYDFVQIDEDRLLVLVGDARGKGIPACMIAAITRSFTHCLVDNFTSLSDFLRAINNKILNINNKLISQNQGDVSFTTVCCCILDRKNSLIEFARAGHTDMVNFIHNHIRVLSPEGCAPGLMPDDIATFDSIYMAFEPGTTIMLYSDGISEAVDENGEEFGMERLIDAFSEECKKNISTEAVIKGIMGKVKAFESDQEDDQTIIIIRHNGDA